MNVSSGPNRGPVPLASDAKYASNVNAFPHGTYDRPPPL